MEFIPWLHRRPPQINHANTDPTTKINTKPGNNALRRLAEPADSTIPPLTTVLDMVARVIALAAVTEVMVPLPLSSDMERVIASTSARPERMLET